MSRFRYYCAMSLDGFIAESDDALTWLTEYDGASGEEVSGAYDRFYAQIGALVMGSVTYEWVLHHVEQWPYAGKPVWVLSSRDLAPPVGEEVDVRIVDADVPRLVGELLAAAGERDVWIVGGGGVASQFADHGQLDLVEVTVVPVVLGSGKRLFERRLPGGPMKLLASRAFANGMVELRYERADRLPGVSRPRSDRRAGP